MFFFIWMLRGIANQNIAKKWKALSFGEFPRCGLRNESDCRRDLLCGFVRLGFL